MPEGFEANHERIYFSILHLQYTLHACMQQAIQHKIVVSILLVVRCNYFVEVCWFSCYIPM